MKQTYDSVQDSGKRESFSTGSVRDTQEGKGTPHLFPPVIGKLISKLYNLHEKNIKLQYINFYLWNFIETGKVSSLLILLQLVPSCFSERGYYEMFRNLAIHYENGAKKYGGHNWRKGQPISRYIDSSVRHFIKMLDGETDEDHKSAFVWNIVAILQTLEDIESGLLPKELNDHITSKEAVGLKKIDNLENELINTDS